MDPGEDPDKDPTIEEIRIRSELIKSFLIFFTLHTLPDDLDQIFFTIQSQAFQNPNPRLFLKPRSDQSDNRMWIMTGKPSWFDSGGWIAGNPFPSVSKNTTVTAFTSTPALYSYIMVTQNMFKYIVHAWRKIWLFEEEKYLICDCARSIQMP